jgi:hypothetical protein
MRPLAPIAALLMALVLGACATPLYSKTQLDALEVRDVEAPPDRAFAAASNAVIDASYQVLVSDGDAGLLTAIRREDPSVAEHVAVFTLTTLLSLGHAPADAQPRFFAVCVQVLPRSGDRSSVRIRTYGPEGAAPDPKTIQQIWTLMQRQVLMKEAARPDPASPR